MLRIDPGAKAFKIGFINYPILIIKRGREIIIRYLIAALYT
jgi:hypothetical protein